MSARTSLKARLLAAFGMVALAGALSGAGAVIGLKKVDQQASVLYERHLLGLSAVKEAEIHLIQVARFRAQFARAGDAAGRAKYRKLFEQNLVATRTALEEAGPRLVTERDQKALKKIQDDLVAYTPHGVEFLDAVDRTEPPTVPPDVERLNQVAIDTFQPVTDGMALLARHKEEVGAAAAKDVTETYDQVRLLVMVSAFMTAGLAVLLGMRLASRLSDQLGGEPEAAARIARNVTSGDLTQSIDVRGRGDGSVLAAMKEMQSKLSSVVGGIRHVAESIATASGQISEGNADLSNRTEQQASNLQRTAATMDQLASTVRNNADTATQAAEMASRASDVAVQGGDKFEALSVGSGFFACGVTDHQTLLCWGRRHRRLRDYYGDYGTTPRRVDF